MAIESERTSSYRIEEVFRKTRRPEEPRKPSSYEAQVNSSRQRFHETLDLLVKGRWIILASLISVVTAVWFYGEQILPQYETSSLIFINKKEPTVTRALNLDVGEDRSLANEILILQQSIALAERVAERLLALETVPETGEALGVLYGAEGQRLTYSQVAARVLGPYTEIALAGRGVDAIRVIGKSTIPGEAALIANMYSEEYIARTQETSRARINASRQFLEDQETKLQRRLQSIEGEVTAYMSQTGAVALDEEAANVVSQISQMEIMRDEAAIEIMMKEASIRSLEEELGKIEPMLARRVASSVDRELTAVQERVADLEVQLEQIYQRYPHLRENPAESEEVRQLTNLMADLHTRKDSLSRQYVQEVLAVGGLDPTLDGAGFSQLADLRKQLAEERIAMTGMVSKQKTAEERLVTYREKLKDIPYQSLQLAQLERSRQSTEGLYVFLVEKLQEARIAEESEIGYAEILRPAGIPGVPVRPQKLKNLMVAVLFGLMLGLAGAILYQRLDIRFHEPDDFRKMGYSALSVIPDLKTLIKSEFKGKETVEVDGQHVSTSLVMLLNPLSSAAESYRRLRTSIQFSRPDTVIETLLITSPEPGEGKSTITANLAIATAQAGRRTLIIDADLRRPRIHKLFGIRKEPGLSDLLFDLRDFNEEDYATDIDGLFIMPMGSKIPNPTEVLGSQKMRELLRVLRQSFDFIILDTPPVLAFSDAMLLSTQTDACIVVASADSSRMPAYATTVDLLESVGAVYIGGVMNRFKPKLTQSYAYNYKYGYKYSGYDYESA